MTSDMTCDRVAELLPDWLEGERAGELVELEKHLDTCPECRTLVEDLQRIVLAAKSLPVREPESDLWPAISGRISTDAAGPAAPERAATVLSMEAGRSRLRRWRAPLAAAAAVLIVATGSLLVLRDAPAPGAPLPGTTAQGSTAGNAEFIANGQSSGDLLADSYGSEIAAMSEILETHRSTLDSSTVAVLERNLAIIDAAIEESREALEQDPASALLTEQLHTAFELKLDVMRRAVILTSGA